MIPVYFIMNKSKNAQKRQHTDTKIMYLWPFYIWLLFSRLLLVTQIQEITILVPKLSLVNTSLKQQLSRIHCMMAFIFSNLQLAELSMISVAVWHEQLSKDSNHIWLLKWAPPKDVSRWLFNLNIIYHLVEWSCLVVNYSYIAHFVQILKKDTWTHSGQSGLGKTGTCSLIESQFPTVGHCSTVPFDFLKWCISLSLANAIHSTTLTHLFSFRLYSMSSSNKRKLDRKKTLSSKQYSFVFLGMAVFCLQNDNRKIFPTLKAPLGIAELKALLNTHLERKKDVLSLLNRIV